MLTFMALGISGLARSMHAFIAAAGPAFQRGIGFMFLIGSVNGRD